MDRNKEILKHCPHFYTIINFEYYSDDIISEKLLDIYQKYIFSVDINNSENIKKIEKLDRVMFRYINDFVFRKEIKQDITKVKVQRGENILESIVTAIINFFDKYDLIAIRRVPVTRWI